jgi:beta-glucanase (GH16 family)
MPLDYNPTTEFHEYRMDYFPDRVDFYIDNLRMKTMTQNIPTEPGRIFINHWSGGNPGWGGGPPAQDASISILYFKGYFNSSDATRQKQLAAKCDKANARTTCKVPDAVLPMSKGAQVFLSSDKRNVVGQETYGLKFGAAGRLRVERGWVVVVAVASAVWLLSS